MALAVGEALSEPVPAKFQMYRDQVHPPHSAEMDLPAEQSNSNRGPILVFLRSRRPGFENADGIAAH
jgi:hypothetical protein